MKKQLWWEIHTDMHQTYLDLEWLIYNFELEIQGISDLPDNYSDNFGPMSEQIWAIKQGLADPVLVD